MIIIDLIKLPKFTIRVKENIIPLSTIKAQEGRSSNYTICYALVRFFKTFSGMIGTIIKTINLIPNEHFLSTVMCNVFPDFQHYIKIGFVIKSLAL